MSMCDGRLLPTPWLDEFGLKETGVPLLQDYVYEAPRLTSEEAQFPELFRATIKVHIFSHIGNAHIRTGCLLVGS